MNLVGVIDQFDSDDKHLILRLMSFSRDPVYVRIGNNHEFNVLPFIDAQYVRKLIKQEKHQTYHPHWWRLKDYTSHKERHSQCKRLLKLLNRHIQENTR